MCILSVIYSLLIRSVLHERTEKLQLEINSLREKLNEEVALCRKEKEEFQVLREKSDALAFEEANAAAIAAAAAYAVESPLVNDLGNHLSIIIIIYRLYFVFSLFSLLN